MRIGTLITGIAWLLLGPGVPWLWADGGTIRVAEQRGRYRITVFTQPTPCRVGRIDVSVLVQDAATSNPLTDAEVMVQLEPVQGPRRTLRAKATSATATNKLLQAAVFEVPMAGRWHGKVSFGSGEEAVSSEFDLEVEEALPPWQSFAGWIGAPAVVIVLFAVHQVLIRRRAVS
jgi:hypothetical protein